MLIHPVRWIHAGIGMHHSSVCVHSYLCLVLVLLWERRLFRSTHRQLKSGAVEEHQRIIYVTAG